MAIHAYTSCSFSYLNRARVLASSLKRYHPDWMLWLVLTDREPDGFVFNISDEDYDYILTAEELFAEETERWLFKHDIVEACTAVKGRATVRILEEPDCDKLFYFDPDIAIFNRLDPVVDILEEYSIVLTPHQVDAESSSDKQSISDNEIASLEYGIFNLGFIAVKNDSEARRFAKWWDERLHDWCHDNLAQGLFVDQKWCNLVVCFFDGVKILRDPGYNVASWNLSQRVVSFDEAGLALVNGHPLRFYHFTKLGPIGDAMTTRYAKDNIEVYELWWWYRNQVQLFSSSEIPKGWWYYGNFENGFKIPKRARELYRSRPDLEVHFPKPRTAGDNSFFNWVQENEPDAMGDTKGFQPV